MAQKATTQMTTLVQASAVGAGIAAIMFIVHMERRKNKHSKAVSSTGMSDERHETQRNGPTDSSVVPALVGNQNAFSVAENLSIGGIPRTNSDAVAFASTTDNPGGFVTKREKKIVEYGSFQLNSVNAANQLYTRNVPDYNH